MKVLAIYRHYWPDTTPYARLLRSILERLTEDGHEASVITGQPSYHDTPQPQQPWKETLSGVSVRRVPLLPERKGWKSVRAINAVLFLMRSAFHAVFVSRYDLLVANAQPPVAIGVLLRLIAMVTGARYVLHLQDIHPEVTRVLAGKPVSTIDSLIRRIDRWGCAGAERLVTLSHDMREALRQRQTKATSVRLINNCRLPTFETDELSDPAEPIDLGPPDSTRLLFAGNLGRFQALEALVLAACTPGVSERCRLTLMGSGIMRERLTQLSNPRGVCFAEHQPLAVAEASMEAADYGVVSLAPGVINYAYPSKTMVYLAVGLPLFAVVEPDSELGSMIRKNRLGLVCPADRSAIEEALFEAADRRPEWDDRERRRIASFYEQRFGEQAMLTAWSQLIAEIASTDSELCAPSEPSLQEAA